jgi:hypothetical protein
MSRRLFHVLAATAVISLPLCAQDMQRHATFRGGAGPGSGKCTVEVVVDGAADVEIRGDNANLHNLSGQPPQWRRFECTGPLPDRPADFRFAGVDGRGRQTLISDPRNNRGAAVVRIEDSDNGAEGYTFDIMWSDRFPQQSEAPRDARPGPPAGRFDGSPDGRFDGRPADGRFDGAPGGDRGDWRRDRDAFQDRDWRMRLFDRVRDDVAHIRSTTFPIGRDQYRLARADRELSDLQAKLARRYFDPRELDDVIGILQGVLRDNRLDRRDYQILSDDLNRMQEFRQRRGDFDRR